MQMRSTLRALGVFSVTMITVGSVDSIRNLPATALFGTSLIFFFIVASIFFLLPSALVSAELASCAKSHGGIYSWVKHAFGPKAGFLAVWFQWVENVIWYPTILSFVAGTIAYMISPDLAHNRFFLVTVILVAFWGTTIINLYGIKTSAWMSNFCAVTGLLLPMCLIMGLGAVWLFSGKPLAIHFNHHDLWPNLHESNLWVSLTAIILSFCGMEIATVHGEDVKDPQHTYPRAMLLSTLILVVTLLLGALSIAIVIPAHELSLVAGIMQTFTVFFGDYHMQWIIPLLALILVIGGMGGVNNWIIAPTRGLLIAARDGNMPQWCRHSNQHHAPSALLWTQAIIVTIITAVFLLMPSVNASYWLLTALASQLYMLMYLFMFAAAIRLRYNDGLDTQHGFQVPGGLRSSQWGMWLVAGAGIIGSFVTFIVGFIPPDNINTGSFWHYESLLLIGLIAMSLPPFLMGRHKTPELNNES